MHDEDMHIRQLAPKTQASYIRAVKKLADYLGHSPHNATAEDLYQFQLHLTNIGTSRITINSTITALWFFYNVILTDQAVLIKLKAVLVPRKLPVVLSREEIGRLLKVTTNLKYKAARSRIVEASGYPDAENIISKSWWPGKITESRVTFSGSTRPTTTTCDTL
jgi:integrase/recombinase XerD